ncbi:serine hydrolase [Streptomyces albidoflavus]
MAARATRRRRHAPRPRLRPGTSWNYSNTNYILAGMVIEKVTGHSWEKEVERRILRPLGLRATSAPRYVFRGPATGPLASGPGMTVAPCRT